MTSLVIHTLVLNIPVFDHSAHQENATQKCIFESSSEMDKGQLISKWNFAFVRISALASKIGQIKKKIMANYHVY